MAETEKPKKKKGYFYETEEAAICKYLESTDEQERNEIYNTFLRPAFKKMISSIIRSYKLYVPDEDYEQTYSDTLSYLMSQIQHFNPTKGFKAFSYCGTVAKNYLLYKNKQYNKNLTRNARFEDAETEVSDQYNIDPNEDTFYDRAPVLITETVKGIKRMLDRAEEYELTEEEKRVGLALCTLMGDWEKIINVDGSNKMRKYDILYFLREETMMSTKEVRDNMKKFKKLYYDCKEKELQ